MIPVVLAAACTTAEPHERHSAAMQSTAEAVSVDELRERAANLRNMAEQFDQEAATFRHEIPGGQPVLQRKAAVSDELRDRAAVLEQQAGVLAAQEALAAGRPSVSPQGPINDRFRHRRLAKELRQMATLRREEAERLVGRRDADPVAIVEKRQLADRLDAIAQDAEQKAIKDERKIPHGMVPQ